MTYLFIDGGYLRKRYADLMNSFYGVVPAIQYEVLAQSLRGQRTYYYDAINYNKGETESDAQYEARIKERHALHDHIASQSGFHVREGRVRRSASARKQEQKGVDVQLAVDALEHAARGNLELATIFAGDLDFEPLFASLARLGVRTRLAYVQGHASQELRQAADETHRITFQHFYHWAAPSFQATRQAIVLEERQAQPDPGWNIVRVGTWRTRNARIYQSPNQTQFKLFVEPGDELSEPSYTMIYTDLAKVAQGFELMFGPVTWQP